MTGSVWLAYTAPTGTISVEIHGQDIRAAWAHLDRVIRESRLDPRNGFWHCTKGPR